MTSHVLGPLTQFWAACLAVLAASAPTPPRHLTAVRMRPRPEWAAPRGTPVRPADVFTTRVFANAHVGFALAGVGNAQFPVRSLDGGRTWRVDGPAVHVDAADGAEGVGYVGVSGPRTFFAYGSSVVDVTTDGGRSWWETYLGELVVAVVPVGGAQLVAYVQQSLDPQGIGPVATWQYVSRDGGRHWRARPQLISLSRIRVPLPASQGSSAQPGSTPPSPRTQIHRRRWRWPA